MNVNIFLRQFSNSTYVDIVNCLRSGNVDGFLEPDRLRFLQKILPDTDEVDLLYQYTGDRDCLGLAERFYLELLTIPKLVDLFLMKSSNICFILYCFGHYSSTCLNFELELQ